MKIQTLFVLVFRLSGLYCRQLWSDEFNAYESQKDPVKEKFYWNALDFQFPNESARNLSLTTGSYIPGNNNILALGVWNTKIFVSVFRTGVGIASSLNYFSNNSATKSPVLIPYPSFDSNYVSEDPAQPTIALPSNSSIISAGYFRIDECDRLWVIDAGFVDFVGARRVLTPPALVIFDLSTDELIRRYTIPEEFVGSNTAFVNLDIDVTNICNDAYAYIVDTFRSIVVYSFRQNRSWRVVHDFFGSDPHQAYFYFGKIRINWNFGVAGIAIGERQRNGSKRVYISPLASTQSYYISNQVLRNETYISLNNYYNDVHLLGDRGNRGQIFTWAYDETTKVLFDAQFYRRQISCWNTANRYTNSSFAVVYKKGQIFFPDDISIDRNRNLWIVSNNLPTFLNGTWRSDDKNIRIFVAKVDDIISGTVCSRRLALNRPNSLYPYVS